ncbi:uncharacterized protein LOC129950949 [Eupeodes corollae]|uniref:uncharacterized protein LOC129950949 n=1 Tax=Eupeodes corollae TaxID=290404 RepID=UPI002490C978|nr:uncharacterized protein LOC129950949 [Eupeodes corollae]XP_055918889.1 uncharacterized protein LOC129950949 [Eupeodes corollae]XP_055918890.1 uncharacterized protein LOC129950949 [Eupeodes corollae]XP_055918891.1 uncharacterized protein LOC129950949 [Eupeodes corollae]
MAAVLKLILTLLFVLAICYQTNVNCFDDNYTLFVSHKFAVERRQLYRFVTRPELVDRWMKWLPFFMAADFKPLGVGKHFMIFSNDYQYLIKVTDHQAGKFLALESELFLRPRIELHFSEEEEEVDDDDDGQGSKSKLEIRMSFQRTSVLFQNTIGRLYRKLLKPKLMESLIKLHGIISHLPETKCCSNDSNDLRPQNSICLY